MTLGGNSGLVAARLDPKTDLFCIIPCLSFIRLGGPEQVWLDAIPDLVWGPKDSRDQLVTINTIPFPIPLPRGGVVRSVLLERHWGLV